MSRCALTGCDGITCARAALGNTPATCVNTASRTYTLEEARRELARKECSTHGHAWDVIGGLDGIPRRVLCTTCGASYRVVPDTPTHEQRDLP